MRLPREVVVTDLEHPVKLLAADRRLTIRLMGLWQARLCSEPCARVDAFFDSLPEDLLNDCFIVEIAADGAYELRRIGKTIGRESNINRESARAADLPPNSLVATVLRQLKNACSFVAPVLDEGETEDENGRVILYRSILLPLHEEDGARVIFLGAARCRDKVAAV